MNDRIDGTDDSSASFEALSATADGEGTERDIARACQAWRDSENARAQWQAYHLIGDVMRSDGAALAGRSDTDFLASLRDRLATEPVVLAPAALVQPASAGTLQAPRLLPGALDGQAARQRRWAGPVSVAAGFVLALGAVLNVMNGAGLTPASDGHGGLTLAQTPAPGAVQALASAAWLPPQDALTPDLGGILRTGLSPDGSNSQRVMSAAPTFTQHGRVEADGRSGYLIFVRDDQLDQLLAARREHAEQRSLVASTSDAPLRAVSFDAARP